MNTSTLQDRIKATIDAYQEPKARWAAMKKIKWRMVCPQLGLWAALQGLQIVGVSDPAKAIVFDARDNETNKLAFYRASTGIQWEIECVS